MKTVLIIMDGWGIAEDPAVSAVEAAKTPWFETAVSRYPYTTLEASEEAVGLPNGQFGNSEVGHTNLGAGRVVYQDLVRITKSFQEETFAQNSTYQELVEYCVQKQKPLHLMGLLSDGGVHSHIDHLKGILKTLSAQANMPQVWLHLFTDGRDTDPRNGKRYLEDLEGYLQELGTGKIATLCGRYDAMDRNKKWDRTAKAWKLLTKGEGPRFETALKAIEASYEAGITDEFVEPAIIDPEGIIREEDAALFFNFRTDRGRQLTIALTQEDKPEVGTHTIPLFFATLTRYDDTFKDIAVLFDKENIAMSLGEVLSNAGKKQIRIAETEKYPHVTFFFNGGQEVPFEGEERILCPSPNVATYDLQPEMSAGDIVAQILPHIQAAEGPDFICLNFANPDMVGHTGVFEAVVRACETVDECTRQVVEAAVEHGYVALVTADHGNADKMRNPDGSPHTAHTTALVPLYMASNNPLPYNLRPGKLGDIAPTILQLMDLEIPEIMTGKSLLEPLTVGNTTN